MADLMIAGLMSTTTITTTTQQHHQQQQQQVIAHVTFTMADLIIAGLLSTDFSLACPCESTLVDYQYSRNN